ncbi:MAG: hypothetical protein RLN70_02255 [Rhodospirillaceae bacterium]
MPTIFMILMPIAITWGDAPEQAYNWYLIVAFSIGSAALLAALNIGNSVYGTLRWTRETPGAYGPGTVELTEAGVHQTNGLEQTFTKWNAILDVFLLGSFLVLKRSPISFILVPNDSFSTHEEFSRFANDARQLWGNARAADKE